MDNYYNKYLKYKKKYLDLKYKKKYLYLKYKKKYLDFLNLNIFFLG